VSPHRKRLRVREIRIQFAFDYVDPGSYVVERLLLRWLEGAGGAIEIERVPLELRPPPGALLEPDDPGWSAMTDGLAEEAGRLGIPFRVPGFIPRTRKAHELALHAAERGCFSRVHEAIF
jgi:predicted DsbA family dithiol-disulfide isomerase